MKNDPEYEVYCDECGWQGWPEDTEEDGCPECGSLEIFSIEEEDE
jgi:hypothetical protein